MLAIRHGVDKFMALFRFNEEVITRVGSQKSNSWVGPDASKEGQLGVKVSVHHCSQTAAGNESTGHFQAHKVIN